MQASMDAGSHLQGASGGRKAPVVGGSPRCVCVPSETCIVLKRRTLRSGTVVAASQSAGCPSRKSPKTRSKRCSSIIECQRLRQRDADRLVASANRMCRCAPYTQRPALQLLALSRRHHTLGGRSWQEHTASRGLCAMSVAEAQPWELEQNRGTAFAHK